MHLQQTKAKSRATGGPQYYFHDVPEPVKEFLRKRGACRVVLQTPYGIASSHFMAVSFDCKLNAKGRPVPGRVDHDRIQQAGARHSIGEAIRHWYGLKVGDFERIDVEVSIHADGHFILVPLAVRMRARSRPKPLPRTYMPLSFHSDHQGKLWKEQVALLRRTAPEDVRWAADQIHQVVHEHRREHARGILESDLLRTAGALSLLGMKLSPYLGDGYDCAESCFEFRGLPQYACPVEIKKRSRGFHYQMRKYPCLPRALVLCMTHDAVYLPDHIDVVELPSLSNYLRA